MLDARQGQNHGRRQQSHFQEISPPASFVKTRSSLRVLKFPSPSMSRSRDVGRLRLALVSSPANLRSIDRQSGSHALRPRRHFIPQTQRNQAESEIPAQTPETRSSRDLRAEIAPLARRFEGKVDSRRRQTGRRRLRPEVGSVSADAKILSGFVRAADLSIQKPNRRSLQSRRR